MEAAAGRSLDRFFQRWVREDAVPVISYSSRVEQGAGGVEAVVRLRQDVEPFDVPVTVSVEYEDGKQSDTVMRLSERLSEQRIRATGKVKRITVNRDGAALGIFRSASW
jgi:aminopeptidase N